MPDIFDNISPLDYRYVQKGLQPYLSEAANVRHMARVEAAIVKALTQAMPERIGPQLADQIFYIADGILAQDVYDEEAKTKHDVKALIDVLRRAVNHPSAKWIHFCATSYDIISTANALRFRQAINKVILPDLTALGQSLALLTKREAKTVQIGRTHGQHAVPITFGYAMAEYCQRLYRSGARLTTDVNKLCGKFSGPVGAFNALSMFVDDPVAVQAEVMASLGLPAADYATQITPPEPLTNVMHDMIVIAGALANLARDIRNLQRTEIAEVGEPFDQSGGQTGSSTMAQKQNPITCENTDGIFKIMVGRMTTVYLDLISDHQRDLTNSVTVRTYGEMIAYLSIMIKNMTRVIGKLTVHKKNMARNLAKQGDLCLAEFLQLLLLDGGHPDAYRVIQELTFQARDTGTALVKLVKADPSLAPYLANLTSRQKRVINNYRRYVGLAPQIAGEIAQIWD